MLKKGKAIGNKPRCKVVLINNDNILVTIVKIKWLQYTLNVD